MQIQAYVQAIREDLARIAAVGDDNTARVAELLAGALEPSFGRRLQDALGEAALELSGQLPDGRVEVRLAGDDPELVYVSSEPTAPMADTPSEAVLSARVTLRLSENLKSRIEDAAATGGVSLNTWIVRTLSRAVEISPRSNSRHRLTGYGTN